MKKLTKKSRRTLVLKRETLQSLNTSGGYDIPGTVFCARSYFICPPPVIPPGVMSKSVCIPWAC